MHVANTYRHIADPVHINMYSPWVSITDVYYNACCDTHKWYILHITPDNFQYLQSTPRRLQKIAAVSGNIKLAEDSWRLGRACGIVVSLSLNSCIPARTGTSCLCCDFTFVRVWTTGRPMTESRGTLGLWTRRESGPAWVGTKETSGSGSGPSTRKTSTLPLEETFHRSCTTLNPWGHVELKDVQSGLGFMFWYLSTLFPKMMTGDWSLKCVLYWRSWRWCMPVFW